jgi:hypothetical protein
MTDKTPAQLEAEVADLRKQSGELKAQADKLPAPQFKSEPHKPYDPTANFGMPRSAVEAMAAAVPDRLMADLRSDALKPNPVTGTSQAQLTPDHGGGRVQIQRGSGWAEPNPLRQPAGVAICDRIMDMADAQDRRDLERRLARSVNTKE